MVVRVSPCPVSVVVPTLNEEHALPRLLDSLFPQLMYEDEVVVVDGGSWDETVGIAEGYGCKIIAEKGSSIGKARQVGSIQAANSIIFSTDADVVLPNEHLNRIRKHFSQNSLLVAVAGPVKDVNNRISSKLGETFNLFRVGMGNNTAFRKEAFLQTDGYPNISNGEDVVFWNRIKAVGPTLFDSEMPVYMDMASFNWQTRPMLGVSAITAGTGIVLRSKSKIAGDFLACAGLGIGGAQGLWELSGHRSIGIIKCVNEECTVERHVHHSGVGAIMMLASLFLEALPIEREVKDEVVAGTAGLGFGMMLHGLVTAPRG